MLRRSMICLSMLAVLSLAPFASAQDKAVKLAVANTQRVLSESQEGKDINAKMEQTKVEFDTQYKAKQAELQGLQQDLQRLKPNVPQFDEARKAFRQKAIEFEIWQKVTQDDITRVRKANIRSLFEKIEKATAEVATKKGVDLVLPDTRQNLPESIEGLSLEQLTGFLSSRNILYSHASIDITAEVVAVMDMRYKEGK